MLESKAKYYEDVLSGKKLAGNTSFFKQKFLYSGRSFLSCDRDQPVTVSLRFKIKLFTKLFLFKRTL